VLREMVEVGLPPGPGALHALVVAHVKAGDLDAALDVANAMGGKGERGRGTVLSCVLCHPR
jgi:hypothetical protein